MKATIVDVAKKAGVSVATVSRVVNGNYPVRESTKKRVQLAIDTLQYVPNLQARELNTQFSTTIGVVVPSVYNMFFSEVIEGIEEYLRRGTYSLLLCCAKNDPALEVQCIQNLISRNVSGIIVISPNTENMDTTFYHRAAKQKPMVFINSIRQTPYASYVSNDEEAGAHKVLDYLHDLGHENILFVGGENSDSYRIKEAAYRNVMAVRGGIKEEHIVNIGEGNCMSTAEQTTERLKTLLPTIDVTAIMCCNDFMAVGALNACKHLRIGVPKDMSIVGYDNVTLSRIVDPKLTTMDQNMASLGRDAAELLIEKIETGRNKHIVLENVLIMGETTGPRKVTR